MISGEGDGGMILYGHPGSYEIDCGSGSDTTVLDIVEQCCAIRALGGLCTSAVYGIDPPGGAVFNGSPEDGTCDWGEVQGYFFQMHLKESDIYTPGASGDNNVSPVFKGEGLYGHELTSIESGAGVVGSGLRFTRERLRVLRWRERLPPEFLISVPAPGSGAVIEAITEQRVDVFGQPYWELVGLDVIDGGAGYAQGGWVYVTVTNGVASYLGYDGTYSQAAFTVNVDKDGAITGVLFGPFGDDIFTGLSGVRVLRYRTQPTLQVLTPEHVAGASFSLALSQNGTGDKAYWSVTAVTVINTGNGWQIGDSIVIVGTGEEDFAMELMASTVVQLVHVEPKLDATVSGGTGAVLYVNMAAKFGSSPTTWEVASVDVSGTTSGYTDRAAVVFSETDAIRYGPEAAAHILTEREEPTFSVSVSSEYGAGADLVLSIDEVADPFSPSPLSAWTVSGITIDSGGSDYQYGDVVSVSVDDGVATLDASNIEQLFSAYVTSVDEDGAIVSVSILSGGYYYTPTDVIAAVVVSSPGEYFALRPDSVVVAHGGRYYIQEFEETTTEITPEKCSEYSSWPVVYEQTQGPDIGESYGNAIVINGFTQFGYSPIRRCELGTLEVTIQ
jgi:hypothetical protein